jgi:hypothetical protein
LPKDGIDSRLDEGEHQAVEAHGEGKGNDADHEKEGIEDKRRSQPAEHIVCCKEGQQEIHPPGNSCVRDATLKAKEILRNLKGLTCLSIASSKAFSVSF